MTSIAIFNQQQDLPIDQRKVQSIVAEMLSLYSIKTDEISLYFVTGDEIQKLHQQFFNNPSFTDCITLPMDPPQSYRGPLHVLGECFICPKAAIESNPKKPGEELTLYIIHTLLHLFGYKDASEEEKNVMRREESTAMLHLQKKHLVL